MEILATVFQPRDASMRTLLGFYTDGLLNEAQARELTRRHWGRFVDVWRKSWNPGWTQNLEDFRARISMSPIARAGVLSQLAKTYAQEMLVADGIRFCHKIGFAKWYLTDSALNHVAIIRFKLLRDNFLVSPSKTEQSNLYFRHLNVAGIDNTATRLNVGMRVNETGTDIESVYITCQLGDDLNFKFRIDDEVLAVPVPVPGEQPSEPLLSPPNIIAKRRPR